MDKEQASLIVPTFRANDQSLIIFAYMLVRTGLLMREIEAITGLSTDTATKAVNSLIVKKMLVKQTGQHGRVVYLPVADSFFGLLDAGQKIFPTQTPQFAESGTTTTTTIGKKSLTSGEVVVAVRQNPQFADSGNKKEPYELRKAREVHQGELDRERREVLEDFGIPVNKNLKACALFGIGEPMASRLSEMKHVTPELIEAHVRSLLDGETKGLAIIRIQNDEMPRLWVEELEKDAGRGKEVMFLSWMEEKTARKQGLSVEQWREAYGDEDDE